MIELYKGELYYSLVIATSLFSSSGGKWAFFCLRTVSSCFCWIGTLEAFICLSFSSGGFATDFNPMLKFFHVIFLTLFFFLVKWNNVTPLIFPLIGSHGHLFITEETLVKQILDDIMFHSVSDEYN